MASCDARLGTRAVCGHPTIIHGGALAAIFDDSFGALFFASRIGNGFTANLSVDYRQGIGGGVTSFEVGDGREWV